VAPAGNAIKFLREHQRPQLQRGGVELCPQIPAAVETVDGPSRACAASSPIATALTASPRPGRRLVFRQPAAQPGRRPSPRPTSKTTPPSAKHPRELRDRLRPPIAVGRPWLEPSQPRVEGPLARAARSAGLVVSREGRPKASTNASGIGDRAEFHDARAGVIGFGGRSLDWR